MKMIEEFYNNLIEFSKTHTPQNNICQQLQAFAVISGLSDLNTENLTKTHKDKGHSYFWSAKWDKAGQSSSNIGFNWPILAVYHMGVTPISRRRDDHQLQLLVLDKYVGSKQSTTYCDKRPEHAVFRDTLKIINQLKSHIKFDTIKDLRQFVGGKDDLKGWSMIITTKVNPCEIYLPTTDNREFIQDDSSCC